MAAKVPIAAIPVTERQASRDQGDKSLMGLISYLHASSAHDRVRNVALVVNELALGTAELAQHVEDLEARIADLEVRVEMLEIDR